MKRSKYLLSKKERRKHRNIAEVRISVWGQVPDRLDALIATHMWGETRAQVYYNLAMAKLRELMAGKL